MKKEIISRHGRIFTDYKSPFGWHFTAEEEARYWEMCHISTKWFNEHYCQPRDKRIVLTNYANYEQKGISKTFR